MPNRPQSQHPKRLEEAAALPYGRTPTSRQELLWELYTFSSSQMGWAQSQPRMASACNFNPRAAMTLRMVSKPGLRWPESVL